MEASISKSETHTHSSLAPFYVISVASGQTDVVAAKRPAGRLFVLYLPYLLHRDSLGSIRMKAGGRGRGGCVFFWGGGYAGFNYCLSERMMLLNCSERVCAGVCV